MQAPLTLDAYNILMSVSRTALHGVLRIRLDEGQIVENCPGIRRGELRQQLVLETTQHHLELEIHSFHSRKTTQRKCTGTETETCMMEEGTNSSRISFVLHNLNEAINPQAEGAAS